MDKVFMAILATSLFIHGGSGACMAMKDPIKEPELTLDELPDRFAKLIIPKKVEEVKKAEVADKGPDEKKEEKKETKKDDGPKETKTAAQTKEEVRQKV